MPLLTCFSLIKKEFSGPSTPVKTTFNFLQCTCKHGPSDTSPVVSGANAGVQPDTVVIKTTNTLVTHTAVLGTGRSKAQISTHLPITAINARCRQIYVYSVCTVDGTYTLTSHRLQ